MENAFELGRVVQTAGISAEKENSVLFSYLCDKALQLHASGHWGDVCDEDWETNENALKNGGRLFSAYWIDGKMTQKIWIITEADRSVTTILFPDEY